MVSEQEVKDAISSVMWDATETHKRLALDAMMTGQRGTSPESYIMTGKIIACKEIASKLRVNLPNLYYEL